MFDGLKKAEKIILFFLFYVLSMGLIISYIDKGLFEGHFVHEDKTLEWLSFAILAASSLICFQRVHQLRSVRSKKFIFFTFFAGVVFLFGAGEEVSWFQRQLNFKVPDFFVEHNSQREANIHNLVVNGKKINKIIFGTGLGIVIASYLLLFPVLYQRREGFRKWVDSMAIPIPQEHHVWCYLFLFLIISLIPHSKRGELLEIGGTCMFLMILLYPKNHEIFKS
jgi:hypothetical protein